MAVTRVTIDELPEQPTPEDSNLFVVQDSGVSKKMSIGVLKTMASDPLTAHLADLSDAHDASAISAIPSGEGVDGASVQAQLTQLTEIVHSADTLIEDPPGSGLYYSPGEMEFMMAGLPIGGVVGQVLAKTVDDDYGTEWVDQSAGGAIPAGGTTTQVLAKASGTDFDTNWVDAGTPDLHATTHEAGGADPVTLTQTQVTGLTADLSAKQPLDADLTVIAALAPADNTILQRKAGGWTASTPSTVKTDLSLTKTDVGLGNVDNTTDANKPVSTATQTALNTKATTAVFTSSTNGLAPLSGGGSTNYLRADGTWAAPAGGGGSSGITVAEAGTPLDTDITTLDFGTGFDLTETPENEVNIALDFTEVTIPQASVTNLTTDLAAKAGTAVFTSGANGLAPLSGGGTAAFLRADGSWALPPGSGGTVGHATYTHNSTLTEPPATGQIRFNNASQLAATRVWVHQNDEDGLDVSIGLAKVLPGHQIYIQDYDNAANWIKYNITAVSDDGAYYDFTVTYNTGPGGIPSGSGAAGRVEFQPVAPGTVGVPPGGTTGQSLTKTNSTDFAVQWATLTKADVGLANVDNTADTAKPVSTAEQTALDAKPASTTVDTIWTGNAAAYAAIGTKDSATLYFVSA